MKKGGAGGKYTWGDLLAGAEAPAPPVLDHNDPNYGSSDDEGAPAGGPVAGSPGQSQNVLAFKQAVSDSLACCGSGSENQDGCQPKGLRDISVRCRRSVPCSRRSAQGQRCLPLTWTLLLSVLAAGHRTRAWDKPMVDSLCSHGRQ